MCSNIMDLQATYFRLRARAANDARWRRLKPVVRLVRGLVRSPFRILLGGWTVLRSVGPLWSLRRGGQRIPLGLTPLEGIRPLIVMLAKAHLPVDPRIEREAKALAGAGFRVKIICPRWWPPAPVPDWGPGVEIE